MTAWAVKSGASFVTKVHMSNPFHPVIVSKMYHGDVRAILRVSRGAALLCSAAALSRRAFAELLVEQVEPDAVVADEFQLGDDQLGVGLFLDLLAAEPFEEIVAGAVLLDRHQREQAR